MEDPPIMLDGARVLEFAELDAPVMTTDRISFVVNGVSLDSSSVSRLLIAENLVEGGVFLMHCNANWETVAAGQYADVETARRAVEVAYAGVAAKWTKFRALSPAEEREVETTRKFLRELAAEDPQ